MAAKAVLILGLALLAGLASAATDPKLTDNLVALIQKKNFDAFVKELTKDNMDVNQPDSKGRLPLIEAVRVKEPRFVDALIQFGAFAKSKDPATGSTPIHIAFQQNMPLVSRTLLAYGADLNAEDKSGKKARDFAPSADIKKLIEAYDKDGAMAFEDEPGTWIRDFKDKEKKEQPYWFNIKTNESRWNTPPSCAWQRVEVQGHPAKYVNAVTGQETYTVPASLAWARVRAHGQDLWYNWRLNVTQVDEPEEMPEDARKEATANINVRWHNTKTGEFSWINPVYNTRWRELKDDTGRVYFFNVESGESVWDPPADMAWVTEKDEGSGLNYYFNKQTGESVWEAPDHMQWVRHDSDL